MHTISNVSPSLLSVSLGMVSRAKALRRQKVLILVAAGRAVAVATTTHATDSRTAAMRSATAL